jgi:hypothetical protein
VAYLLAHCPKVLGIFQDILEEGLYFSDAPYLAPFVLLLIGDRVSDELRL